MRSSTLKQLVVNAGFLSRVRDSIEANQSYPEAHVTSFQVLTMLANRNQQIKIQLVDELGIVALANNSLTRHRDHIGVVQAGLQLMVSISYEPELQPVCVSGGLIPTIVTAMRLHQNQPSIQLDAIWIALNLCWSTVENRELVKAEGLLPFVIEARMRHSRTPHLEDKATQLLERVDPNLLHSSTGRVVLSRK